VERLLVVDDEPPLRRIIARILSQHGYAVVLAEDVPEAIACLHAHAGALSAVLVDYHLPSGSGTQVLQVAKEISPGTRRVLMTGSVDFERIQASAGDLVCETLAKPVAVSDLVRALRIPARL